MIQPFFCDFFTGTVLHRFLDIITWHIGKQTVYPYAYFIFILILELSLTVNGPAQQPSGILAADNTAGHYLSTLRIAFTDIGNIWNNLIIQCGNGCRFPVCLLNIGTEFLRMSEGRILLRNVFPQAPASTGTYLCISVWCMVLITVNGTFGTASVGDKYQIVLCQHDSFFLTFHLALNLSCHLFIIPDIKQYIRYFRIETEFHAGIFQIVLHRKNQGFILVVFCKLQCTEIRKSTDMMDEAHCASSQKQTWYASITRMWNSALLHQIHLQSSCRTGLHLW